MGNHEKERLETRGNMNKHTERHVIGMVLAGIMLLSVPAHSGETQSRTLRPDEPNPEPALFGNVAPSDTVYFNVSVYTPGGYTLDKTEWSRTGNNPLFLWAGSGMSFSLVNTAWEPGTTTARVDAWWNGGEGGGGAGGGGSIHRYATGTASAEGATESELYVRVSPAVAPVGNGVSGSAFGKKIPSGEEFAVSANWSVSAPGYFKSGNQNVSSVSFSSDEPESVQVTAVNNGPPARQGSASAQFVKVVSISADPAVVCAGTWPEFTVVTNPDDEQYHGLVQIEFDENTPGAQEAVATCGSSSASTWVTVVGAIFDKTEVVKCVADGEYNAAANLTADSYDPEGFVWTLNVIEGDDTAEIDEETGNVTFGCGDGWGKYEIRATPASLQTCYAEITLTIITVITETVSISPADSRDRRIIGLGEEVNCYVRPSIITSWLVFGKGYVRMKNATWTTLVADRSAGDVTVSAQVGEVNIAIDFAIVSPEGKVVFHNTDLGLGAPGTNNIGARSSFDIFVTPETVSFYRLQFREKIPGEEFVWPDGTQDGIPAEIKTWSVLFNNWTQDESRRGPDPIERIHNGTSYVDFSFAKRVPDEYQNEEGEWISFLPDVTHDREYRGSDMKARVRINASDSDEGGWMGPWE